MYVDYHYKRETGSTPTSVTEAHENQHDTLGRIFTVFWYLSFIPYPKYQVFNKEQTQKFAKQLNVTDSFEFRKRITSYMSLLSFAVVRCDTEIKWLDVFQCFRPTTPSFRKACLVIHRLRPSRFISALTTFCNPVSLYICSGEPGYLESAVRTQIVTDVLILAFHYTMDTQDLNFEHLRERALEDVKLPAFFGSVDRRHERPSSRLVLRDFSDNESSDLASPVSRATVNPPHLSNTDYYLTRQRLARLSTSRSVQNRRPAPVPFPPTETESESLADIALNRRMTRNFLEPHSQTLR